LLAAFEDGVLRLTLNRPEVRNALNSSLIAALIEAFDAMRKRTDVRAVILTGAGDKAFCSGADLSPEAATFGFDYGSPTTAFADLLRIARSTPVPIIGRINGHCLAGGMGLLAVCDMAVAASTAKFGLPEVKVGMFPMQVAALLQAIIPDRKFRELCFTGDLLSSEEALGLGLLNYVVAPTELDAKIDGLAQRVRAVSPTANRRGKHALNAIASLTGDQALAYMEGQVALLPLTEDGREGLAAFAARRPPVWTGR
jgi:enoyl-CoA hydratase/carnithine racemase